MRKALFIKFYNGAFTSKEVDEMQMQEFNQYCEAMRVIESKELLTKLTVSDFPHYKSAKRKEIYNKIKLNMNAGRSVANSTQEIAEMLKGLNG